MYLIWIYISILLLILISQIFYRVKDIKVIRVFGFELIGLLFYLLVLILIIGEVFLPMPKYYIKHGRGEFVGDSNIIREITLNEILQEEILKSGIEFDDGSFRILDSHGMHFNHLFLCSYEIDGEEEARIFHLEKNIFGNMKPKRPLNESYIIPKSNNWDDFYHSYFEDGIFAGYRVVAGFGSPPSTVVNYTLNKYTMERIHPRGYFMWIEMVREPWKSISIKIILYTIFLTIINRFQNKKRESIKFYSKWRKGNRIFSISKLE